MRKKEVTIKFVNGVEASPIALLVQTANRFSSSIYIESGDKKVNVKSIMGMMSLAMNYEDMVTVVTEGEECTNDQITTILALVEAYLRTYKTHETE